MRQCWIHKKKAAPNALEMPNPFAPASGLSSALGTSASCRPFGPLIPLPCRGFPASGAGISCMEAGVGRAPAAERLPYAKTLQPPGTRSLSLMLPALVSYEAEPIGVVAV